MQHDGQTTIRVNEDQGGYSVEQTTATRLAWFADEDDAKSYADDRRAPAPIERKRWTEEEETKLGELHDMDSSLASIAAQLDRTEEAIRRKARAMNLPFSRAGHPLPPETVEMPETRTVGEDEPEPPRVSG